MDVHINMNMKSYVTKAAITAELGIDTTILKTAWND